ncbi:MAG: hypothetical protein AAF492_22300 [Verrucomicrobiota bacterium]
MPAELTFSRNPSGGGCIVVGHTQSTNITLVDAVKSSLTGGVDGFLLKVNSAGTSFDYSTYIGGEGSDKIVVVEYLSNQNVLVAGTTTSTNLPLPSGIQTTLSGGADGFLMKLSEQ